MDKERLKYYKEIESILAALVDKYVANKGTKMNLSPALHQRKEQAKHGFYGLIQGYY